MAKQAMAVLGKKGPRAQKGTPLFVLDHGYCMCCHPKAKMHENSECTLCHRGERRFMSRPAELQALKDLRAMPGNEWAAKKEKIIKQWCKPIMGAQGMKKSELMRRQMEERNSVETILVEARDHSATDFEKNKEMMDC